MVHGSRLSMDPTLKRWVNGLKHSKGIPRMISPGWCLELVLVAFAKALFEPIATCSLKHLTWKTAFSLAFTPNHRASEMHALSCKAPYLRFSNAGVMLFTNLSFLPKIATKENASYPIFEPFCGSRKIKFDHILVHFVQEQC